MTETAGQRPVFVAGLGLASTLGPDLGAALQKLAAGLPAAPPRQLVPGESRPHLALAAPADEGWHQRARHVISAVVAESGARPDAATPLYVASSSINIGAFEAGEALGADGFEFCEKVAAWLDWPGPVYWLNTACTSALNALLSAQRLIATGVADSALVLGLELENRYSAAGFAGMQLLAPEVARPLAAGRNGLVLGEAVAAVWLQSGTAGELAPTALAPDCKKNRPTPLRWRLRGGANVVDGRDPAGASVPAVAAMARRALQAAGLEAGAIDLIKLQAAGSPHNDDAEIAGLREVFAPLPALCSLKPLLGHTLGAAGAAELALLLHCQLADCWPPQTPVAADPTLGVQLAGGWPARRRYLMVIILGFGGGHAAVVLEDTAAA